MVLRIILPAIYLFSLGECKKRKKKECVNKRRKITLNISKLCKDSLKSTAGKYHPPTKLLHQSCLFYKLYPMRMPTWLSLLLKHTCEKYFFSY